jgi:hypothetical protein
MTPFFIEIPNFWAWADQFLGIWGIFGQTISTHFSTGNPLSMFSIIQPLFLQKTKRSNFQNPDCPETGHFPSRTPDFEPS